MATCVRTFYAEPLTFMDMLLECSRYLDTARHDEGASKADVLESMENRLSLLVGKLASQPTSGAFAIRLQEDKS
jgi:hypothetical protein